MVFMSCMIIANKCLDALKIKVFTWTSSLYRYANVSTSHNFEVTGTEQLCTACIIIRPGYWRTFKFCLFIVEKSLQYFLIEHIYKINLIMSAEKRPASNSFSSSQLVKRQRSDTDLNSSSEGALVNGSRQSGAIIQSVSSHISQIQID